MFLNVICNGILMIVPSLCGEISRNHLYGGAHPMPMMLTTLRGSGLTGLFTYQGDIPIAVGKNNEGMKLVGGS
jgi:hypothetical protein